MRKITTAILLIIATTGNVFARQTSADCERYGSGDSCDFGCYYSGTSEICTACPSGTYDGNSETNQTSCTSCKDTKYINLLSELKSFTYNDTPPSDIPENGLWYYDPNYVGAEDESECAVVIKCPAGTGMYLTSDNHTSLTCEKCAKIKNPTSGESDRETDYNYFSSTVTTLNINNWKEYSGTGVILNYDGCSECPANSTVAKDHKSCTCNAGYHNDNSAGQTDAAKNADTSITNPNHKCTENKYPVTVYHDCDVASPTEACNGTVAYKNPLSAAISSCSPEKTGYHRTDDTLYEKKGTNDKISTIEAINATEPGTTYELCPIWVANKFEIKYQAGNYIENMPAAFVNNGPITENTTVTCEYNAECIISSDTPIAANSAYVFIGWKITGITGGKLVEGYDTQTTYSKGAVFKNATADDGAIITLTAQWQECPAGYYGCTADNLEGNPCPAGSTSNPGATDITGCFITSATQFCSGETCFKLGVCAQQTDGTWKDCPGRNNSQTTN